MNLSEAPLIPAKSNDLTRLIELQRSCNGLMVASIADVELLETAFDITRPLIAKFFHLWKAYILTKIELEDVVCVAAKELNLPAEGLFLK